MRLFCRKQASGPDAAIDPADITRIEVEKTRLRDLARTRRAEAYSIDSVNAAEQLAKQVINNVPLNETAVVAGYWPGRQEIDCRVLLEQLATIDRRLVMPVIVSPGQALEFRLWHPEMQMVPGRFGIPEPPPSAESLSPDILLVPLIGFDRQGQRIGMGGGFYDRTLEALRAEKPVLAVGVAFAVQELPSIPVLPHDQPLDWIVTEREAIRVKELTFDPYLFRR